MNTSKLKITILIFISCLTTLVKAQQNYDSLYIKKYYNKSIWALYENYNNHSIFISQSFHKDSLINTSLQPIAESKIDIGISYSNEKYYFAFNLLSLLNKEPTRKPAPKAINFVIGITNSNKLFELGANWFTGYYENNSKNIVPNFNDTTPFHSYDKLNTVNFFLNKITFTNKRKFSYSAVYKGTELQKKSAASFVHYISANYNRFKSDSAFVPIYVRSSYDNYGNLNKLTNVYLSGGIGFSGTLVIGKVFFTNLTLMAGPGIQYQNYSFLNNGGNENKINVLLHSDVRYSIGLNLKRFYLVSSTTIALKAYSVSKLNITSGHLMSNLTIGYRYNRKGRIF
jgi:hypothetical protein